MADDQVSCGNGNAMVRPGNAKLQMRRWTHGLRNVLCRYFTAETGKDGATYEKKTGRPMCQELGDRYMMIDYVEEAGDTILCDAVTGTNCSEKEKAFARKYSEADAEQLESQLSRLAEMSDLKSELQQWVYRRVRILKQLRNQLQAAEGGGAHEEG